MSKQQAGLNYEHEIANGVYRATDGRLLPLRVGWSGNQSVPSPDVVLDAGDKVHAFELKRTTQDRISITHDSEDGDDDITELLTFAHDYPRTVVPTVGIRFTNRQLVFLRIWPTDNAGKLVESVVGTAPIDASVTHKGNISVHRPPTTAEATKDEKGWPSATDGDDISYVLDYIDW